MNRLLALLAVLACMAAFGQSQPIKVLTLGTFHFSFPNLDVSKTEAKDQIDVLDPKYQREIETIVRDLARFRPTIIAIEREPSRQARCDSLYQSYLLGTSSLTRGEEQQIGFRLAKRLGLKKLYCVDTDGRHYQDVLDLLDGKDSAAYRNFEDAFYTNPDSAIKFHPESIFKTEGILPQLRRMNEEVSLRKDLGNYLIGPFKFGTGENPYFGTDFVTGQWFSRNLRIFRNIQRIDAKPTDRILVIFGAGHMNLLNIFFKSSPEYDLVRTADYLK